MQKEKHQQIFFWLCCELLQHISVFGYVVS